MFGDTRIKTFMQIHTEHKRTSSNMSFMHEKVKHVNNSSNSKVNASCTNIAFAADLMRCFSCAIKYL